MEYSKSELHKPERSNARLCRALHVCAVLFSGGFARPFGRQKPLNVLLPLLAINRCGRRLTNFQANGNRRRALSQLWLSKSQNEVEIGVVGIDAWAGQNDFPLRTSSNRGVTAGKTAHQSVLPLPFRDGSTAEKGCRMKGAASPTIGIKGLASSGTRQKSDNREIKSPRGPAFKFTKQGRQLRQGCQRPVYDAVHISGNGSPGGVLILPAQLTNAKPASPPAVSKVRAIADATRSSMRDRCADPCSQGRGGPHLSCHRNCTHTVECWHYGCPFVKEGA